MLSANNIRNFRDELKFMLSQCDELLKTRSRQKMFNNDDEVKEAEIARIRMPQEYYYFRLFKYYIELNYSKNNGFYIFTENYAPKTEELRSLCNNANSSIYNLRCKTFEEAVRYFELFCVDLIHFYYKDYSQLIYMY